MFRGEKGCEELEVCVVRLLSCSNAVAAIRGDLVLDHPKKDDSQCLVAEALDSIVLEVSDIQTRVYIICSTMLSLPCVRQL